MKLKLMLMYVDNQQQHGHKDKEMIGRMDMLRHCAVTASSAVRFCCARQSCGLPNCRVDSIGMPLKTFSPCILCYITQVSTFSAQVVSKNIGNFRPLLSFQVFARWNTSFGGESSSTGDPNVLTDVKKLRNSKVFPVRESRIEQRQRAPLAPKYGHLDGVEV